MTACNFLLLVSAFVKHASTVFSKSHTHTRMAYTCQAKDVGAVNRHGVLMPTHSGHCVQNMSTVFGLDIGKFSLVNGMPQVFALLPMQIHK